VGGQLLDALAVVEQLAAGGGRVPAMALRVVVLPAPLAPISETSSPWASSRLMPFTASMAP
jgi:hypothetical protein